jgi:hypothetical protein
MPNNPNNTTPVLTPGGNLAPSQQTNPPGAVPYIENGLTYQSNNPDFVERDDNGNIIVNQGATDNQNLVLEATSLRYVNASVIRNIDTRFKYFRFPAENVAVPVISFEGFGIDDLVDLVYAKYRPSEPDTLSSTSQYSGVDMSDVLEGLPQLNSNSYTITPEIKELAVDGLRMRIKLAHRYTAIGIDLGNSYYDDSNPEFDGSDITREDWDNLKPFVRQVFQQDEAKWTRDDGFGDGDRLIVFNKFMIDTNGNENAARDLLYQYIESTGESNLGESDINEVVSNYNAILNNQATNLGTAESAGTVFFSIIKSEFSTADIIRDFRELTVAAGQTTAFINANTTKISEYDIIIPNEDIQAGDQLQIGAIVGQFVNNSNTLTSTGRIRIHTLLQSPTQWSITDASRNVDENNNEIE